MSTSTAIAAPTNLLHGWRNLKVVANHLQKSFVQRDVSGYSLDGILNQAATQMSSAMFTSGGLWDAACDFGTQKALEVTAKLLLRSNLVAQLLTGATQLGHGCIWDPQLTTAVDALINQQRQALASQDSVMMTPGEAWFPYFGSAIRLARKDRA